MKPSLGRIVHFVDERGVHLAAIITWAYEDAEQSIDLTAFYRDSDASSNSGGVTVSRVPFSVSVSQPETWHWPERVE